MQKRGNETALTVLASFNPRPIFCSHRRLVRLVMQCCYLHCASWNCPSVFCRDDVVEVRTTLNSSIFPPPQCARRRKHKQPTEVTEDDGPSEAKIACNHNIGPSQGNFEHVAVFFPCQKYPNREKTKRRGAVKGGHDAGRRWARFPGLN